MPKFIIAVCFIASVGCSTRGAPTQPNDQEWSNRLTVDQSNDRPGPPPIEPFNITIAGLDTLPILSWQRTAVKQAIIKWEEVITSGLPDFNGVDDIVIHFRWGGDREGWLASASPFFTRPGDHGLPYLGIVTFYSMMKDSRFDKADWEQITLHEICHAIGFSSWQLDRIVGLETISGTRYFMGENAARAYRQILFENGEKMAYAIPDLHVPMESTNTHWNGKALRWDLMAPYYFGNVLTNVTIQAMRDIGYSVDETQAESPPLRLLKPALSGHNKMFYCDGQNTRLVTSP